MDAVEEYPRESLTTSSVHTKGSDGRQSPPQKETRTAKQPAISPVDPKHDAPQPRTPVKAIPALDAIANPVVAVYEEPKPLPVVAPATAPPINRPQKVAEAKPASKTAQASRPAEPIPNHPQAARVHQRTAPPAKSQLFTPPETTRYDARFDRPMEQVVAKTRRSLADEADKETSQNALSVIKHISDTGDTIARPYERYERGHQEVNQALERGVGQVSRTNGCLLLLWQLIHLTLARYHCSCFQPGGEPFNRGQSVEQRIYRKGWER